MENYLVKANDFAKKHKIKFTILSYKYGKHFVGDKDSRYIFKCKLQRNGKSYTFNFGQSISQGSEQPNLYEVLSCLTKYDPGSFKNFCGDFGYDTDSISALKTYKLVCKEWGAVERLFGDIIEELIEIE